MTMSLKIKLLFCEHEILWGSELDRTHPHPKKKEKEKKKKKEKKERKTGPVSRQRFLKDSSLSKDHKCRV